MRVGGSNPALRTVYYRLLRLLSNNITPLFVFDGPHRPGFKRGHKKNTHLTPALIRLSKKLLKLFGCPFHTAPGEAEAECALLNRAGVVDAVLSEDVDTLMFGARTVIRKWSGEGKNSAPTHVTVYDSAAIDAETGLRREGIVLVALMRGGDYLPEGMPGCGIKTAVEAARAGFGDDLFAVRADGQRLAAWRERLQHELASNESGCFKRRNGRVAVPPAFPDAEILGFYAEPVVSDADTLARLRNAIRWDSPLDAVALRVRIGKRGAKFPSRGQFQMRDVGKIVRLHSGGIKQNVVPFQNAYLRSCRRTRRKSISIHRIQIIQTRFHRRRA